MKDFDTQMLREEHWLRVLTMIIYEETSLEFEVGLMNVHLHQSAKAFRTIISRESFLRYLSSAFSEVMCLDEGVINLLTIYFNFFPLYQKQLRRQAGGFLRW